MNVILGFGSVDVIEFNMMVIVLDYIYVFVVDDVYIFDMVWDELYLEICNLIG